MIRTVIGALLLFFGVITMVVATVGLFRFHYVLNRMQAAALIDTLGILSVLSGLIVLSGYTALSAKMLLIILFLWLASPVTSHLIARAEVLLHPAIEEECEVIHDDGTI